MATQVKNTNSDWLFFENIQPVAVYHHNPSLLEEDYSLQLPTIRNFIKSGVTADISVEIPDMGRPCNVYMFVEGKKSDLFYNVGPGVYTFKNVSYLKRKVEFFYVTGVRKSKTITLE